MQITIPTAHAVEFFNALRVKRINGDHGNLLTLLRDKINEAARILGQKGGIIGGRSRSKAKIKAARENGKLGGRPRKDGSK